jgi:hypothetical protein
MRLKYVDDTSVISVHGMEKLREFLSPKAYHLPWKRNYGTRLPRFMFFFIETEPPYYVTLIGTYRSRVAQAV